MKKEPFLHTPNIEWKNGAWRYRVPPHERDVYPVTWHKIGVTVADVYNFLAQQSRNSAADSAFIGTINRALDKYAAEVLPLKAAATRRINMISIARIRAVFGKSHPLSIKTPDIYQYRDMAGEKHGKKSANNDLEVISHLYSKMIEWGVIENWQHPTRKQRIKFSLPSRDRYVQHWEIIEAMTVANDMLQIYIPFKIKTGLDKSTILRISNEDITEEGIYYYRKKLQRHDSAKRPKKRLIEWDDELRALCEAARALRSGRGSHLFSTRTGGPYIDADGRTDGFNSIWSRFMAKVLERTKVDERFTEHDLRAKSASDETDPGIASSRLDHSSQRTTDQVYRRKAERRGTLRLDGLGLEGLISGARSARISRDTSAEKRYRTKKVTA